MGTTEVKVIKPITFDEVYEQKTNKLPEELIDVINSLILDKFNTYDKSSKIYYEEIEELCSLEKLVIYANNWFNEIPDLYSKFGWDVEQYKPSCFESFKPYFVFSKK